MFLTVLVLVLVSFNLRWEAGVDMVGTWVGSNVSILRQ